MSAIPDNEGMTIMRTVARFRLLNRSAGKKITGFGLEANDPPVPLDLDPNPPPEVKAGDDYTSANVTAPEPIPSCQAVRVVLATDPPTSPPLGLTCLLPGVAAVQEVLAVLGPVPYQTGDGLWLRVSWLDAHGQLCHVITPGVSPIYIG